MPRSSSQYQNWLPALEDASFDDDARAVEQLYGSDVYGAVGVCPAGLRFLLNGTWHDLYVESMQCNPARPCCLSTLITLLLGSRGRNATRTNGASHLRVVAETLRKHVQEWALLPLDASDAPTSPRRPHRTSVRSTESYPNGRRRPSRRPST